MNSPEFYNEAFRKATTGEKYNLPPGLRKAVEHICSVYGIRGICDPMYVANVIAHEMGFGDGKGNFYPENIKGKE